MGVVGDLKGSGDWGRFEFAENPILSKMGTFLLMNIFEHQYSFHFLRNKIFLHSFSNEFMFELSHKKETVYVVTVPTLHSDFSFLSSCNVLFF